MKQIRGHKISKIKTSCDKELLQRSLPDDIREKGWSVAVHNDYSLYGERYTFWLFTRIDRCVKGEGKTDSDALDAVRREIAKLEIK